MQHLIRPAAPTCLAQYRHGQHNWDNISSQEKAAIRQSLEPMQRGLCAYCEAALKAWHIEHFYPRDRYPQRTFDWDNLFGSCNSAESCGGYKDQKGKPYQPHDLIHPCQHHPDSFLFFSQDGQVQPRVNLSATDYQRAQETIRVFNLNMPDLCERRAAVVQSLLSMEPDILSVLPECTDDERQLLVADFLQTYASGSHPTPIRHLLTL
jgi:uncharacterized protein (TIGR02646 family)